MNNFILWLRDNYMFIIFSIVAISGFITLMYNNRKDLLTKSALYIVAKVEEEWGSNTGRIKFAEAYTYLKQTYPIITFFLPEEVLRNLIEEALVQLKDILATKASLGPKDNK